MKKTFLISSLIIILAGLAGWYLVQRTVVFQIDHTVKDGFLTELSGNIAPDLPIQVGLSRDREQLTISGSVNQVIHAKELPDGLTGELVDSLMEPSAAVFISDINFDGYSDIETVPTSGNGHNSDRYEYVFLFNKDTRQFVYNSSASRIPNLYTDSATPNMLISSTVNYESDEDRSSTRAYYAWKGGTLTLDHYAVLTETLGEKVSEVKSAYGTLESRDNITKKWEAETIFPSSEDAQKKLEQTLPGGYAFKLLKIDENGYHFSVTGPKNRAPVYYRVSLAGAVTKEK